jgi:hypothetical protein
LEIYFTRYPNATEIDNTGIGNQPYVIETSTPDIYRDYHPLLKPISIPLTGSYIPPIPTPATTPSPVETPSPTAIPTPTPSVTSPTPTDSLPNDGPTSPPNFNSDLTVTYALLAVSIVFVVSLLLYRRHRKAI